MNRFLQPALLPFVPLLMSLLVGANAQAAATAPTETPCPANTGEGTRCLEGRDDNGAFILIALPKGWDAKTGTVVLHAHGGPFLGAPTAKRVREDLERWSIMPRLGYAWAATSYAQGGVALTAATQDMERLRQLFITQYGRPKHVILHGQSWGGGVAAKTAETFTTSADKKPPFDAVLLSSGVLGAGTPSYDFRLDLRVIYQDLCHNHPLPDEPQYPLNIGLPAGSKLTEAELRQRVDGCLGLNKPAAERSAEQTGKLQTLLAAVRIPERSIVSHLSWATWHFQDIVTQRTGGTSPFGNEGVAYAGSPDDKALNARVPRYTADPQAFARFNADAALTGRIPVPVLDVHAIHDPTAFVELENRYAALVAAAGRSDAFVQTFTEDREHSYLSDPSYAALMQALLAWVDEGRKPSPAGVAAACVDFQKSLGSTCRFKPDYSPPPLESRVPARHNP